jgi:hypothetical protein
VDAIARATASGAHKISVVFTGSIRVVVAKLAGILDNDGHGLSETEKD